MKSRRNVLRLSWRERAIICLSVVFLVGVGTYLHTVQYWFVATDSLTLIETSRIRTVTDFVQIFTQPLMHGSGFTDVALFYRPLSSLSYAVGYSLWGVSPGGYHLTNVVLHAVAAVLVAITIREMTTRPAVGYLSGVLFTVHPLTVDVVPAIARRQDILVAIFVLATLLLFVRSRRADRPRLFGGAVVAYALALGAKETALVVPGLVFFWVAVHQEASEWRSRIVTALIPMVPFIGITLVYIIVRVAVLGGLGGYRPGVGSGSVSTWVFVPVKYLLWIAQPTTIVKTTLGNLPRPILTIGVVGAVVVGTGLIWWRRLHRRFTPIQLAVLSISGVSFGVLSGVVMFATPLEALVPMGADKSAAVVQYLVGTLFVGGCLTGVLAAALGWNPPLDTMTHRQFMFFAGWMIGIPGLLIVTGAGIGTPLAIGDGIQTGYLCIVPAMAGLSLLIVAAGRRLFDDIRFEETQSDANALVAIFAALLLISLIASSPLVHPYSGWKKAGEANERTLTNLDQASDRVDSSVPTSAYASSRNKSDEPLLATSIKPLSDYSTEAWIKLTYPANRSDWNSQENRRGVSVKKPRVAFVFSALESVRVYYSSSRAA
jgi:hypothetical protein